MRFRSGTRGLKLVNMALLYINDQGVPKDEPRGYEYLRRAAEAGCGRCAVSVGHQLQSGISWPAERRRVVPQGKRAGNVDRGMQPAHFRVQEPEGTPPYFEPGRPPRSKY
jgi:hypothetical protein